MTKKVKIQLFFISNSFYFEIMKIYKAHIHTHKRIYICSNDYIKLKAVFLTCVTKKRKCKLFEGMYIN